VIGASIGGIFIGFILASLCFIVYISKLPLNFYDWKSLKVAFHAMKSESVEVKILTKI